MKILAIDVGTGTQDILLLDTADAVENAIKLVMPSPTLLIGRHVRELTPLRTPIVLKGPMMGGGPCAWAIRDHAAAGVPTYATPDAARTLDDDLARVEEMGVRIVGDDEARSLDAEAIRSGDLMLRSVLDALEAFGVYDRPDVLAVAVFDHGHAPPGESDRRFRFAYLERALARGEGLTAFAHERGRVPEELTRLRAVEGQAPPDVPLVLMDTGPAAVLGALEDPAARPRGGESALIANVGNFHALAFHLGDGGSVAGLFEHHTGELDRPSMERLLRALGNGTLSNEEVFGSMGHGALVRDAGAGPPATLAVLGPQRNLLLGSPLAPSFAAPHGDQMLAGCYGLLRGVAARLPSCAEEIAAALDSTAVRQPSW